jgi:DNA repair protein RadC
MGNASLIDSLPYSTSHCYFASSEATSAAVVYALFPNGGNVAFKHQHAFIGTLQRTARAFPEIYRELSFKSSKI